MTISLATRASDIAAIGRCPGGLVLKMVHPEAQAPTAWYLKGNAVHATIEASVLQDLDLDGAQAFAGAWVDRELEAVATPIIETSQVSLLFLRDDVRTLLTNFFQQVHPDSPARLPIYDEYEWPFQPEIRFSRSAEECGTKYPVSGTVDALFTRKGGDGHAIVDWKSGSKKIEDTSQPNHYRLGLNQPEAHAWFHHLARVHRDSIIQQADPFNEGAARQRAIATEAIKDATFIDKRYPLFHPGVLCQTCPMQSVCPARGSRVDRESRAQDLRLRLRQVELVA